MAQRQKRAITSERVKRDAPAYRIVIQKCGGLSTLCDITGFAPATVHNWLRSGLIPAKWYEPNLSYQRYIMGRAALSGIAVTPSDFIEGMGA